MLKALTIVVILILASTSAVAYSTVRSITVQTDKSYYHVGDTVYISGIVTVNGGPVASKLVSIDVRLSGSSLPIHLASKYTDNGISTYGVYTDSFTLSVNAIMGEYIVSVTVSVADMTVTNQATFQLGPALSVPVVPLGTLTASVAMILVLAAYFAFAKRKRARPIV